VILAGARQQIKKKRCIWPAKIYNRNLILRRQIRLPLYEKIQEAVDSLRVPVMECGL
jgi:hypothetical protein